MPELNKLNLIASRLLCALLLNGESLNDLPIEGQMRMVGAAKRISFYDARKELEVAGWVRIERPAGRQARIILQSAKTSPIHPVPTPSELARNTLTMYVLRDSPVPLPEPAREELVPLKVATPDGTSTIEGSYPESTYPIEGSYPEWYYPDPTSTIESTYQSDTSTTERHYSSNGSTNGRYHPEGLADRCRRADEMDESGDMMVRTSPAQARRREQLPLVREAYKQFFPKDHALTEKSAKEFLSWNDNSALQVYQELERIAHLKPDLQYPLAYVRKVFKAESERRPAAPAKSFQSATPSDMAPVAPLWDGEQLDPSAAWREKAERARAYAKEKWGED